MTTRLLVAGASGFLGHNLVKDLPQDWEVVATYHMNSEFPHFLESQGLDHVEAIRVDLADEDMVRSRLGKVTFDAIVNLAGNVDLVQAQRDPHEDWRKNVGSILNLSRFCRADHLIHFSSGAVYDGLRGKIHPGVPLRPRFAYAISKLAAEYYAAAFMNARTNALTVVRFFGAFGPHEPPRKIYTKLVRAFAFEKTNSFDVVGDGLNLIDAMYVDDAIRGIRAILDRPSGHVIVDFGLGNPLTIDELVRSAAKTFGISEVEIHHSGTPVEHIEFSCTADAFEDLFAFRPKTTLEVGLHRLADWLARKPNLGSA